MVIFGKKFNHSLRSKKGKIAMADGIPCKHCGHQEATHGYPEDLEKPRQRLPGYRKSLLVCSGYVLAYEPEQDEEALEFEMAALEVRARGRSAWGRFSAAVRNQEFLKKCNDFGSDTEGKKAFIEDCRSENRGGGFYIGG